jgi:hypothetical protein
MRIASLAMLVSSILFVFLFLSFQEIFIILAILITVQLLGADSPPRKIEKQSTNRCLKRWKST